MEKNTSIKKYILKKDMEIKISIVTEKWYTRMRDGMRENIYIFFLKGEINVRYCEN